MEITTVKDNGNDGYLVNGNMTIPNAQGNRHYQMVQEWIAATHVVGTPPSEDYSPQVGTPQSDDYMPQVGIEASIDYDPNVLTNSVEPFETQAEITAREEEEAANAAKVAKVLALATLTVTTSSGNTFDGNEAARLNMNNAISSSQFLSLTSTTWKLADNSTVVIQLAELQEALALSIQAVGSIVTS